ncbi:MAG: hypothetical protein HYU05_01480 [Candidatus Wildermuthbacteria bacterium]|nr:hypothetical protein [Candidatus Wildermuthbacteria bacterium]
MEQKTIIRVIGIGGAGGNAIERMMQCEVKGIELVAVNTDAQDLKKIRAHKKIRIGKETTKGLGAGMNPDIGKRSALESKEELAEAVRNADMVFLASGLGGGTGGGAIPIVAELAKSQGALTIAIVTRPFAFEGAWRGKLADAALLDLASKVDTLLVISNDQILKIADPETSVISAFWHAGDLRPLARGRNFAPGGAGHFRPHHNARNHQRGFCGFEKHYGQFRAGGLWHGQGERGEAHRDGAGDGPAFSTA